MLIHPEIFTTPDYPVVRFRAERDQINLDTDLPRILDVQGWDVGTYFYVQFMSHDRSELMADAKFVVTELKENIQINEANPYQPVTKAVAKRKAEQRGEWWIPEARKTRKKPGPKPKAVSNVV
jgi:hypothetical protein